MAVIGSAGSVCGSLSVVPSILERRKITVSRSITDGAQKSPTASDRLLLGRDVLGRLFAVYTGTGGGCAGHLADGGTPHRDTDRFAVNRHACPADQYALADGHADSSPCHAHFNRAAADGHGNARAADGHSGSTYSYDRSAYRDA